MAKCYSCGEEFPVFMSYCENCKAPLPSLNQVNMGKCPECGTRIGYNWSECSSCHIELVGVNAPIASSGAEEENIEDFEEFSQAYQQVIRQYQLKAPVIPSLEDLEKLVKQVNYDEISVPQRGRIAALYLAFARIKQDDEHFYKALFELGLAYTLDQDFYAAARIYYKAYTEASMKKDKPAMAQSMNAFGAAHEEIGNFHTAEQAFKESILIYKELKDYDGYYETLSNLFTSLMYQEKYDLASKVFQELLQLCQMNYTNPLKEEYLASMFLMLSHLYWARLNNSEFLDKNREQLKEALTYFLQLLERLDLRFIHFILIEKLLAIWLKTHPDITETLINQLLQKTEKSIDEYVVMKFKLMSAYHDLGMEEKEAVILNEIFELEPRVKEINIQQVIEVFRLREFSRKHGIIIQSATHVLPEELTTVSLQKQNEQKLLKMQFHPVETVYGINAVISRKKLKQLLKTLINAGKEGNTRTRIFTILKQVGKERFTVQAIDPTLKEGEKLLQVPFLQGNEVLILLGKEKNITVALEIIGMSVIRDPVKGNKYESYVIHGYLLTPRIREEPKKEFREALEKFFEEPMTFHEIHIILPKTKTKYYYPILGPKYNNSNSNTS